MNYPQEQVLPQGYKGKDKKEMVEQMFDQIACTYDRLNHIMSLGIDRYWRGKAIKALQPHKPRMIMDVATGTGDFAILAYKMLHPAQLIGTDISDGMMAIAKEKVCKAGLSQGISFAHEDCTQLSFEEKKFDAITVAFGIRNFASLDKGLSEMHRVLKDGGHLVILELSTPQKFPVKQMYCIYSKILIPLIGRLISKDCSAYTYLPESIKACTQGQELCEAIRRVGFKNVRFETLTFGICTLYTATK